MLLEESGGATVPPPPSSVGKYSVQMCSVASLAFTSIHTSHWLCFVKSLACQVPNCGSSGVIKRLDIDQDPRLWHNGANAGVDGAELQLPLFFTP